MSQAFLALIFVGLAAAFCSYWVSDAFLEKKPGRLRKWHLPVVLAAGVVYILLHNIGFINAISETALVFQLCYNLCTSILLIGGIQALFQGGPVKKGFLIVVTFVLMALGQMLYMIIARVILGGLESVQLGRGNLGVTVVQCMLCLGLKALRYRKKAMSGSTRLYAVQSVIPLMSLVLLWLQVYASLYSHFTRWDVLSFLCVLLINFVLYYVFETMELVYAQNREYTLQNQRHALLEEYYQRVEAHQKEVRRIKHDLKNQLISIGAYLDEEGREKAGAQIEAMMEALSEQKAYAFTAHPGLNALLGAKFRQAEQAGITCEYEIKLPSDLRIREQDLVQMAGNVLDNAFEACRHCSEKAYIHLRMLYYSGSLVLFCENSTDGAHQSLESRKEYSGDHGIGMRSIAETVRRYRGEMQHQFGDSSFRIELTLFTET